MSYANADMRAAHMRVAYAVKTGVIAPAAIQKCNDCENNAVLYHHYNGYSREATLDVIPLCKSCHAKAHNGNNGPRK